jgi:hypothetical protein
MALVFVPSYPSIFCFSTLDGGKTLFGSIKEQIRRHHGLSEGMPI